MRYETDDDFVAEIKEQQQAQRLLAEADELARQERRRRGLDREPVKSKRFDPKPLRVALSYERKRHYHHTGEDKYLRTYGIGFAGRDNGLRSDGGMFN